MESLAYLSLRYSSTQGRVRAEEGPTVSQVRQVRQVRQAGTYRVEYNATCPVIWNEVLPEDPKATGERVMECVERGIEEAVGSALDVKMRLELRWPS